MAEICEPRWKAELRAIPTRCFPPPGAARRQLGPHPEARPDAGLLRHLVDERQLRQLLHHHDDRAAELRGEERRLDVLLVLVPVADDERFLVLKHGHDREQLRLGARLEAVVIGPAILEDALDHVAILVDLDGIDPLVDPLVAVLGDGAPERLVQLHDPAAQDLRKPDQQGRSDAAQPDLVDQFLEVDLRALGAGRMDRHVAGGIDGEIRTPPVAYAVGLDRVGDGPATGHPSDNGHLGSKPPFRRAAAARRV
jgi:hypothetical protein